MLSAPLSRRTVLLAAAATALAACSTRTQLASNHSGQQSPAVPPADPNLDDANPVLATRPTSIAMVGDSITQGSKDALQSVFEGLGFTEIVINAERSRRIEIGNKKPLPGLDVVTYIAGTAPPDLWVIALGTNDAGLYNDDEEYQQIIDDLLEPIPADAPLVWIDVYRDDHIDGCEQFNTVLRTTLKDRGKATIGDWYQQCSADDAKLLNKDGVHPNDRGVLVFASVVRNAVAEYV